VCVLKLQNFFYFLFFLLVHHSDEGKTCKAMAYGDDGRLFAWATADRLEVICCDKWKKNNNHAYSVDILCFVRSSASFNTE
jgi:hypothetical protein